MIIISGTKQFHIEEKTAAAIGKFDGVHLGHRALLAQLTQQKKNGLKSCVFTFDPSPDQLFGTGSEKELTTREEKRAIFEKLGVDFLVEFPLDRETAAMAPETFVTQVLAGQMHAAFVAAGPDLSFGDRGAGDFALLEGMAPALSMETRMIPKVVLDGQVISSSLIRECIADGKIDEANRYLGEPYSVTGKVKHGNEIGRTIDVPTINVLPAEEKLLPPFGVYYTRVSLDGRPEYGMTNIGMKPTIHEAVKRVTVETYLYNYQGNAYGENAVVELLTFRRPEIRFDGLDALRTQMQKDIAAGREYFGL